MGTCWFLSIAFGGTSSLEFVPAEMHPCYKQNHETLDVGNCATHCGIVDDAASVFFWRARSVKFIGNERVRAFRRGLVRRTEALSLEFAGGFVFRGHRRCSFPEWCRADFAQAFAG